MATPLQTRVDLTERDRATIHVRDQGWTGSCVGQATAAAVDIVRPGDYRQSARFSYYVARAQDGFENEDQGAYIRSSMKALGISGSCVESAFPWSEKAINKPPTRTARTRALTWRGAYVRCQSLRDIMTMLSNGSPVVFGFSVYENIGEADDTGILPVKPEGQLLGGHAVLAVGYDATNGRVKFQNSWGTSWGDGGFGYMHQDYFSPFGAIVDDAWALVGEV